MHALIITSELKQCYNYYFAVLEYCLDATELKLGHLDLFKKNFFRISMP